MSADILGARLLADVQEEGLDDVSPASRPLKSFLQLSTPPRFPCSHPLELQTMIAEKNDMYSF